MQTHSHVTVTPSLYINSLWDFNPVLMRQAAAKLPCSIMSPVNTGPDTDDLMTRCLYVCYCVKSARDE